MKYKLILCLIILSIFSAIVFASNTPPPIPTEYWGRLMIDGEPAPDGTPVNYFNGEDWINTTTLDGWYNIIMTGGDSDLTYNDDPDCSTHWGDEEACIPCTQDVDCVEGPQEGNDITIIVNNANIPVIWGDNVSSEETDFSIIGLKQGWNLRSLQLKEKDNSIEKMTQNLSGQIVIWNYNESGDWNVYDSNAPFPWLNTLKTMGYGKAYWIKSETNQNFGFAGTSPDKKTITLEPGWNFVGFNASEVPLPDAIGSLTEPIVVWEYNETGDWNVYDSNAPFPWLNTLQKMRQTMGYWIKSTIEQIWEI